MSNAQESATESSRLAHELANKTENPAANVAQWLEDTHHGTLCTISTESGLEGFPHGSIVPFAISSDGHPYILVAEIAAHTRNLLDSSKSCLFMSHPNPNGDPQSFWRISLLGNFSRILSQSRAGDLSDEKLSKSIIISEEEENNMLMRYCQRVPNAENYLKMHNFFFWKMDVLERVRYIAGFGKICWIEGKEVIDQISDPDFGDVTQESIDHMNEDHEDAMIEICQGLHNIDPSSVKMLDIDPGGIMLQTDAPSHKLYSSFGKRIKADDLRVEIIKLLKRARKSSE